jgi:hypothetical protein
MFLSKAEVRPLSGTCQKATFSLRQSAKQIRSDRSSDGIHLKRPFTAGVCCEVLREIGWATLTRGKAVPL